MRPERLLARIRAGHVNTVRFDDFTALAESVGFRLHRQQGSHRIYKHARARLELVLTDRRGLARAYQIREFLSMVADYSLKTEERP